MKRLFILCVLMALIVLAARTQTVANRDVGLSEHVTVLVSGDPVLKRSEWSSYAPLRFGTALRRGDLLRLDGQAQAKIVCSDLSVHELSPGTHGVPCAEPRTPLIHRDSPINPTRDFSSPAIPFIISPRRTAIRNSNPTLRWSQVQGANRYTVAIRADPDFYWAATVGAVTQLKYPGSAPPLRQGSSYKLVVAANDRHSNEEQTPHLGFWILDDRQAKLVRNEERRIAALNLPRAATRFLLAKLYSESQLNSEAIEVLEELMKTAPEPASARLLGDLYMSASLARHAELRYLSALDRSSQSDDDEGSAIAHRCLSKVYRVLGNAVLVEQHIEAARSLYRKLGDQLLAADLEKN
jgi:hypothetical protein